MIDTSTTVHVAHALRLDTAPTGSWSIAGVTQPKPRLRARGLLEVGMALSLFAFPATAVTDSWFDERRKRDTSTVVCLVRHPIGRPISRAEALKIVRGILLRAEQERRDLAEWEAARGLQWEERQ